MKPRERLGDPERAVVEERTGTAAFVHRELRTFGGPLEPTLRALINVLLPGVAPAIDVAGFVDEHASTALGRGDRRPDVPPAPQLFIDGLTALTDIGFAGLLPAEQRQAVTAMRHGDGAAGMSGLMAKEMIDRLLEKALAGYLSHPQTWQRIGFGGPAYPDGYAWIGVEGAAARRARVAGWNRL